MRPARALLLAGSLATVATVGYGGLRYAEAQTRSEARAAIERMLQRPFAGGRVAYGAITDGEGGGFVVTDLRVDIQDASILIARLELAGSPLDLVAGVVDVKARSAHVMGLEHHGQPLMINVAKLEAADLDLNRLDAASFKGLLGSLHAGPLGAQGIRLTYGSVGMMTFADVSIDGVADMRVGNIAHHGMTVSYGGVDARVAKVSASPIKLIWDEVTDKVAVDPAYPNTWVTEGIALDIGGGRLTLTRVESSQEPRATGIGASLAFAGLSMAGAPVSFHDGAGRIAVETDRGNGAFRLSQLRADIPGLFRLDARLGMVGMPVALIEAGQGDIDPATLAGARLEALHVAYEDDGLIRAALTAIGRRFGRTPIEMATALADAVAEGSMGLPISGLPGEPAERARLVETFLHTPGRLQASIEPAEPAPMGALGAIFDGQEAPGVALRLELAPKG